MDINWLAVSGAVIILLLAWLVSYKDWIDGVMNKPATRNFIDEYLWWIALAVVVPVFTILKWSLDVTTSLALVYIVVGSIIFYAVIIVIGKEG